MVIVDTSVWSVALRKTGTSQPSARNSLVTLIKHRGVVMLGPIRQEILSGISEQKHFNQLRTELSHFPDFALLASDFEQAAICFNRCRSRGVQGANTDFLICAVSLRNDFPILTTDLDFQKFQKVLGIRLFQG